MKLLDFKLMRPDVGLHVPIPDYATEGSAAIDLCAVCGENILLMPGESAVLVPTGIAVDMRDSALAMMILPRSGLGHKHGIVLGNGTGLVDSDYQGEIMVSLRNTSHLPYTVIPGERIAQAVFVPIVRVKLCRVEEFASETKRASGGFGSTGKM